MKRSPERDYSHRSLIEKLGVRPDHRVCAIDVTAAEFLTLLENAVEQATARALHGKYDIVFLQIDGVRALEKIARAADHLEPTGVLWIIHPKGKGASPPDSEVRAAGLATGLVDNKISAYNETHTATRYVHRKRS